MSDNDPANLSTGSLLKIVYFDEQSASDYLEVSAGGTTESRTEYIRKRTAETHANLDAKLSARFSWLPFFGVSSEATGSVDAGRIGQSILSQTLSNTILTDYIEEVSGDDRVVELRGYEVSAPKESMAFIKMYTPYMVMASTQDAGIDLARMDEALERAKGYYELLAQNTTAPQDKSILRFNITAFRNNYGLSDLPRMRLVFHAIRVGDSTEASLNIEAEMGDGPGSRDRVPSPAEILAGPSQVGNQQLRPQDAADRLPVYDVVLAGVEHG